MKYWKYKTLRLYKNVIFNYCFNMSISCFKIKYSSWSDFYEYYLFCLDYLKHKKNET